MDEELDFTIAEGAEYDFWHYTERKQTLKSLLAQLEDLSTPAASLGPTAGTSGEMADPTCQQASDRLALERRAAKLKRMTDRAEAGLAAMPENVRYVIEGMYINDTTRGQLALELHVSRGELYRLRDSGLAVYARVAGLV